MNRGMRMKEKILAGANVKKAVQIESVTLDSGTYQYYVCPPPAVF